MQVESVAWIAETNNVLAGVFSLAAIRVWLAFADGSGVRRWVWYWLASALFLLALFSKPTAVVVPLIAAILDVGIIRRPTGRMILSLIPWLGLAVMFGFIARQVQPAIGALLARRPLIALDALGFYVRHIFWPSHLTVDYARTVKRIGLSRQWIVNAIIPVAIAILLWRTWRRHRAACGRRRHRAGGGASGPGADPIQPAGDFDRRRPVRVSDDARPRPSGRLGLAADRRAGGCDHHGASRGLACLAYLQSASDLEKHVHSGRAYAGD